MDTQCRIEMFGQLKAIRAGQELTRFRTHKIGWILAYLALHPGQSVPRERLLDLFWPEMDVETGRGNLNNALSSLRRQLDLPGFPGNSILVADRQSVRLDPQTVRTDVQEFEELLQAVSRTTAGPQQISLLECATSLYRGELLPGCYEEWALQEQQRLHSLYTDTLGRWSDALEKIGDLSNALAVTQRAVQTDVYREEFYRRQMRLQAMLEQPAAALESYRQLEQRFKDDLGAAPSTATRELARQLREDPNAFVRASQTLPPAAPEPTPPVAPPTQPSPAPASPASALPLVMTRYFGRAEEQATLAMMLAGQENRLVTLLGPGGAGKTRLSLEIARQLSPVFAGRVWWLSLADLPDARLFSSALVRALQISDTGATDLLELALARLNEAPALLVLDNIEHLLRDEATGSAKGDQGHLDTATALVRLLLERAPNLVCLVTSRRALRLNGEQEYPLPSLPLPAVSASPEEVLKSPSVALYADRARLARPDFAVTAHNAEAIARLCQKLEGMPLAIEMAAAWAKVIPPAKMLERLEERLDALTALSGRRRDLPLRHQSIRATIDWSYDLLDAPQKRLLARLSVFRGGWSLEATEAICADGEEDILDLLTSLVDKSLVIYEESEDEGRYRLLETVRQYGYDRLEESGEAAQIRARHFAFFREMAEASVALVQGAKQVECLDQLEREHDNMRTALAWARTDEGRQLGGAEAELDLASWLRPFWDRRNYWREGRANLEAALKRAQASEPTEIRARALMAAGVLAANMGDFAAARPLYEECLRFRQQSGDARGIGGITMALGNIARDEKNYTEAHRWYERCDAVVRSINDTWLLTTLLGNRSVLAHREGDFVNNLHYVEESLVLARERGDQSAIGIMLHSLCILHTNQGNTARAFAALEESLTILGKVRDWRHLTIALHQFAAQELLRRKFVNAVRFIGLTQRIREEIGVVPSVYAEQGLQEARQNIGEEAVAIALAEGRALEREQAIQEAMETIAEVRKEISEKV